MAYDKDKIFNSIIDAIRDNKLKHLSYIEAFVEPCTKTIYEMFPEKSNELHAIKRELALNKINSKNKLRNSWEDSDNPTLQIAAFKLMADDDELDKLTSSKFDHKSGDGSMTPKNTIVTTLTEAQLKEALKQ